MQAARAEPVAVGLGDVAAVVGVADGELLVGAVAEGLAVDALAEAVWLTLAATEALVDELADAVDAVGVFDEVAEHPALANASPAAKMVMP